jgi:hypothetical protein
MNNRYYPDVIKFIIKGKKVEVESGEMKDHP